MGKTSNMGDDAAQIKALMGQLFEAIGAAKSEEEQAMVLGGAMFFLAGIGQLSESLGEDATACTREQWDAFEMQPVEGVSDEDFMSGLLCFLGLVAMAVEGKEEVQAALRELAASPDF